MDLNALDRWITGNYGEDQYGEECAGCEDDENAPHTCDLAEPEYEYPTPEEKFEEDLWGIEQDSYDLPTRYYEV